MKKILSLLLLIVIIFFAAKLLKERKSTAESVATPTLPLLTISLIEAKEGSAKRRENFLALLASQREAKISTKLSGYIKKIAVLESQKVKRGTLLVEIDNGELLASLKTLEATLKQQKNDYLLSKKIYDRNQKLHKAGALPQEKLEELEIGLEGKKTQIVSSAEKIKQLSIQLEYLDIRAPYDGTIGRILVREGNLATPGQPILTLSQPQQKMTFSFAPQHQYIKEGQSVLREGKSIGSIKTIYTQAKNGLSVAEVELIKPLDLPEGTFISIDVVLGEYKGCIVPSDTLVHKRDATQVMLYREEKFTPFDIEVLYANDEEALIQPCPRGDIARGSETKLSKLPFYGKIKIRSIEDE
ncbi:MAG: efflux RND transporter periplasmic adaptor subunit [Campylobacterota bacterium]|nr:efflux RND transporter periplasmic adaptor subunit [Campylobacterota bacterium]